MSSDFSVKRKRDMLQAKYNSARADLMVMLVFTLVNIILLVFDADVMMLFSATVPYYALVFAMYVSESLLVPAVIIMLASLVAYALCWAFSEKHYGWMIAALVMFIIDTVCLVLLYWFLEDVSGILDFVIHAVLLYYFFMGAKSGRELSKLPKEEMLENSESEFSLENTYDTSMKNSSKLRIADPNVKARILLEAEAIGRHIEYRRVKHTNELVIDGNVYDEYEKKMEQPHELGAVIDGHTIIAGLNSNNYSYILVDGEEVARKMRWW